MYDDFDIGSLMIQASGMDSYLSGEEDDYEPIVDYTDALTTRRIASVDDLKGFKRIASNTLVRKAERDLWALKQNDDGEWLIERLFDDDGNPITV